MKEYYTYEQAIAALQVKMTNAAKFEDFVKTKPSKNTILHLLNIKRKSILRDKFPKNQRQKRKAIRNNPTLLR